MLFSQPDATDDEINESLKAANAYEFIEGKMQDGIETTIGGTGG